jgi:hypothetical protein
LWDSLEEEDSQKKTIKEIKRILTLEEDKESTLEVKTNSMISDTPPR